MGLRSVQRDPFRVKKSTDALVIIIGGGSRLPIIQGGTFTFIPPALAILNLPENQCPADFKTNGWGPDYTPEMKTREWQRRILELQGAICIASCFQVIFGYCGILGLVLDYITPLTIGPSVAMIGISLFANASEQVRTLTYSISCFLDLDGILVHLFIFYKTKNDHL